MNKSLKEALYKNHEKILFVVDKTNQPTIYNRQQKQNIIGTYTISLSMKSARLILEVPGVF